MHAMANASPVIPYRKIFSFQNSLVKCVAATIEWRRTLKRSEHRSEVDQSNGQSAVTDAVSHIRNGR